MTSHRFHKPIFLNDHLEDFQASTSDGEGIAEGGFDFPLQTVINQSMMTFKKAFYVQMWSRYTLLVGESGQARIRLTTPAGTLYQGPIRDVIGPDYLLASEVIEIPLSEIVDGQYIAGFWQKATTGTVISVMGPGYIVLRTL